MRPTSSARTHPGCPDVCFTPRPKRRLRVGSIAVLGAALALLANIGCRPAGESAEPPQRIVAEMNRGVSLMGQYLYEDAVAAFQEVAKAAPELTDAKLNLAIALFNRNRKEDLEAASKLLSDILRKEPANLRALYFNAIVQQQIGKAELAVPSLEKVLKQRPDDGAAWYLLALCKQRTGQPAEAEFLKAVQYRPYLYSAYYQLYQTSMRAGDEKRAAGYLEQFKKLRESPLGESIELPQYNQMGELALARPLPASSAPRIARSHYQLKSPTTLLAWPQASPPPSNPQMPWSGAAAADLNHDGLVDLVVPLGRPGRLAVLMQGPAGQFTNTTAASGLEPVADALTCAAGDFDNDDVPDLLAVTPVGARLFKGKGDGTFAEITQSAGLNGAAAEPRSAIFLDADHDGDLDILVCGAKANQLWNNNGNGVFANMAAGAALACANGDSGLGLPGDLDKDRAMDLVILRHGQPARMFLNQLLGQFREADLRPLDIRGDLGGILQDFNGDGLRDLMVLGGSPAELKLFLGDGHALAGASDSLASVAKAAKSWGPMAGFRVADLDLDGDLDVVCFGADLHFVLNDGQGHFVLQAQTWKPGKGQTLAGLEVCDVNGDLVPDLLAIETGVTNQLLLVAGELIPPSTALALQPNGIRSRDGRTRSPASAYGATITSRAGLREHRVFLNGQAGGFNQSCLPVILGLGGVGKADYVQIQWPDGVAQAEIGLAAGQTHKVAELQRKISSCPVLFAWNGSRFEFLTDFAGVGGLGYFSAPGVSAPPQVQEHVKIESSQLRERNGSYELRVTEPMEESAYIDRLELLAIDHPDGQPVFPDERLAISGPLPSHELLVVNKPLFPLRALDPSGRDCAQSLARVDRIYAYEPELDRRYIGFCKAHSLELDFGDALRDFGPDDRVVLFINGFIEYPYSQTVYAASQSRVGWEPIRVEAQQPDGAWNTIVPDGGAPGGMARTMTIEVTGKLNPATRRLRLTTNLEIRYDQIFLARLARTDRATVRTVRLQEAALRYLGFPREYSPDGREPMIYDYQHCDASASFHTLKGAYTRYGSVESLLKEFDDQYVLMGPGDEIALRFDAAALPPLQPGFTRSFILASHAYCKDMDLYTATPQTLDPLPFKTMSRYPYPPGEHYPQTETNRAFQQTFNTRLVE